MVNKVIWAPAARNDFSNILDYLNANWNKHVSLKFIDVTDKAVEQILLKPRQCPVVSKRNNIRKYVLTKHNTRYFAVRKNSIEILRIFDVRQTPDKLELPV